MTRTEKQPGGYPKPLRRSTETVPAADGFFDVNDPVRDYLHMLRKIPLLTKKEEIELATSIENGKIAQERLNAPDAKWTRSEKIQLRRQRDAGIAAQNEMTNKNLPLVVSIAKRYLGRGVRFLDLIQEGNIGLMTATIKYDVKRGFRFSTYATWWIRQAVTRAISDQSRTIRTPMSAHENLHAIIKIQKKLTQELHREPTAAEIAAELPDIHADKVDFYLKRNQPILSLDKPIDDDENLNLGDTLLSDPESSSDEHLTHIIQKEQVEYILNRLSPREARILRLHYGLNEYGDHSMAEVGRKMGITRERVRQLESEALSYLRHRVARQQFEGYLDGDDTDR